MNKKYFQDTDTALISFSENGIAETQEVSENIYLDLDRQGNLVSMTIEHAKETGALSVFSYKEIKDKSAQIPDTQKTAHFLTTHLIFCSFLDKLR